LLDEWTGKDYKHESSEDVKYEAPEPVSPHAPMGESSSSFEPLAKYEDPNLGVPTMVTRAMKSQL